MMLHCDFVEQQSADGDDGKLRPDLIVKLPGNRQIVVDSKAPITAYLEAHEATTDELRKVKIRCTRSSCAATSRRSRRKATGSSSSPRPKWW